ncbi:hypothetical protein AB1E18_015232 [Capra hircus]
MGVPAPRTPPPPPPFSPSLPAAIETGLRGPGPCPGAPPAAPSPLPRASPPLGIGPSGNAAGRLSPVCGARAGPRARPGAAQPSPRAELATKDESVPTKFLRLLTAYRQARLN